MPSFDVVSKVDMQEVDNAVNSVVREITNRYDFKGSNTSVERSEEEVTILADDEYKLAQVQDMLKVHFTRRKVNSQSLSFETAEKASGNMLRQKVKIKQGIDKESSKIIIVVRLVAFYCIKSSSARKSCF